MDLKLTNRVALVAGASRGIGQAIAESLAREGVHVAALGRTAAGVEETARRCAALGVKSLALTADVSRPADLDGAVERATKELGAPTILVLAVAVVWEPHRLQFESDEVIAAQFQTDLTAAAWLCKRLLPGMVAANFGRVLALSSLASQAGMPGGAGYAAAKAGLEGLMRGIALDYGKKGVTANALQLGFVETERLASRLKDSSNTREKLAGAAAQKRILAPKEVGDAVAFLASPLAEGITGATIPLTAGAHLNTLW